MLKKSLLLFTGIFIISAIMASETRLLRQPAVSDNHLAFAYGGNIWITDLYGGKAKRLTRPLTTYVPAPRYLPDCRDHHMGRTYWDLGLSAAY